MNNFDWLLIKTKIVHTEPKKGDIQSFKAIGF